MDLGLEIHGTNCLFEHRESVYTEEQHVLYFPWFFRSLSILSLNLELSFVPTVMLRISLICSFAADIKMLLFGKNSHILILTKKELFFTKGTNFFNTF